jgi:hypothetical protein
VLNPRDGVRYALPWLLAPSFLAGCGLAATAARLRAPALAWAGAVALVAAFGAYTSPVLRARATTPSPPAQAAAWVESHLPPDAVLLVERDLTMHAAVMLPRHGRMAVEEGFDRLAGEERPAYLFGETVGPGSTVFSWPDSDAYGKLTRLLYRVTAVTPVPPAARYQALRGVHRWERDVAGAGWRWLDGDAAIRLHARGAPEAELTLALPERVPWESNRVSVAAGTAPAVTVEVPRGQARTVALPRRRLAVQLVGVRFGPRGETIP